MRRSFTKAQLVFLFLCCWGVKCNAQGYVTLPDSNFAKYLRNTLYLNSPTAVVGNQLDTTDGSVLAYTHLLIPVSGITNLYGIQFFKSLTVLSCPINAVSSLPMLPPNVQIVDISGNQLTSLPSLPASLTELNCSGNKLSVLPSLPASLNKLDCSYNTLPTLPPLLPASLITLVCCFNNLSTLPPIPPGLQNLNCGSNTISNLAPLSVNLRTLDCSNNLLTALSTLPDTMYQLFCYGNMISCFPTIPKTIRPPYTPPHGSTEYFLDLDPNPYNCLPNYIPAMGSDTLTHPLCGVGNTNGCPVTATGIAPINNTLTPVKIMPNPNNGIFTLESSEPYLQSVEVFDADGRLVLHLMVSGEKEIDASVLNKGVYYLNVRSNQKSSTSKLVIIK